MNKKGEKDMHVEPVTETITDISAVLSLKAVHNYADRHVERGHAEYNKGSILVKSQHPLDQCLRRGIIEDEHHEIGKMLRNYRDCALSTISGRTYNAPGEGDPEMDAATVYANVMRAMNAASGVRNQWRLIATVCFAEPDIDGHYFSEREYSMLYAVAPNLQHALEVAREAIAKAREDLKTKIDAAKRNAPTNVRG